MEQLNTIASRFQFEGEVLKVEPYGSGNLNKTYLVTLDSPAEEHFVLQRINTHVFTRPKLIMQNLRTFTEHMAGRLESEPVPSGRRWEMPRVYQARDGADYYLDSEGGFWRAISFVADSRTFETVQSVAHAREAGHALGTFQHLISDLEIGRLHDTLEGFHITPRYLAHFDQVLATTTRPLGPMEVRYGLEFVQARRHWASVLEDAQAQGELELRPIHGDPKINNIMICERTGQAVSIVDLDTVKPGLVQYDIGDCLRSCCNPLGEETLQIDLVRFEMDLAEAILQGYLCSVNGFFGRNDYRYLYDAIRLIAFELGLRFFTDYLEGNVYFRAEDDEHNLRRALVQFKLTESIEAQEADLRQLVHSLQQVPSSQLGVHS